MELVYSIKKNRDGTSTSLNSNFMYGMEFGCNPIHKPSITLFCHNPAYKNYKNKIIVQSIRIGITWLTTHSACKCIMGGGAQQDDT